MPQPSALHSPRDVWRHPEFARAMRDMAGPALGIAAWGLVTGVATVKSGLSPVVAVLMSLVVFAGSAQLAALPLLASSAPMWVIWATALCLNLRFVIFSAGWRPYLAQRSRGHRLAMGYLAADLNYVVFLQRFPQAKPEASDAHVAYFWGGAVLTWSTWQVTSLMGIALGDQIPTAWGLSFAGTLALLGLTCSLLVDRNALIAAVVAGSAAVAAYALPLKLNLLVAIAAAVAIGVTMDHWRRPVSRPDQGGKVDGQGGANVEHKGEGTA